MHRRLTALFALLLWACGPRLGALDVQYGGDIVLPIVHPSNDVTRLYVVLWSEKLGGERLFFLDTGYGYTTCDDGFADELGLVRKGRVQLHGEAGTISAKKARLPDFDLGTHEVLDLACVVRDLNTTSSITDPDEVAVAGVLGMDVLRRFRVVIDPQEASLSLRDPSQVQALERDADGVFRIRREYGFGVRALAPFATNGHEHWLVLDTGATGTHVDGRKYRLKPTRKLENVSIRGTGKKGSVVRDLVQFDVPSAQIATLNTGELTLSNRKRAPWVYGLLGLDVLRHYREDLDFVSGLAHFAPVVPHVPSYQTFDANRQKDAPSPP